MKLEMDDHVMWAETTSAAGHRVFTGKWLYDNVNMNFRRLIVFNNKMLNGSFSDHSLVFSSRRVHI